MNFRSSARLIRSTRAGVGKSLQKADLCRRVRAQAEDANDVNDVTISLHKFVDTDSIIKRLTHEFGDAGDKHASGIDVIHLDIAHEVQKHANSQ